MGPVEGRPGYFTWQCPYYPRCKARAAGPAERPAHFCQVAPLIVPAKEYEAKQQQTRDGSVDVMLGSILTEYGEAAAERAKPQAASCKTCRKLTERGCHERGSCADCSKRWQAAMMSGKCDLIAPFREIYGLLYTHHKVPDSILRLMLQSIEFAGLPNDHLVLCGHRPDSRFPSDAKLVIRDSSHYLKEYPKIGFAAAIYEQQLAGLEAIPDGAVVCLLEHDCLYPPDYFHTISELNYRPDTIYSWVQMRQLDARPGSVDFFWQLNDRGETCFASTLSGVKELLVANIQANFDEWRQTQAIRCIEPLGRKWERIKTDGDSPIIDIHHGRNTSNGLSIAQQGKRKSRTSPVWGPARQLKARISDLRIDGKIVPPPLPPEPAPQEGVGTELSKLFAKVGIVATPDCKCKERAGIMNKNGPDWCKENIETIIDWLSEEAANRKLPFVRLVGKALVKRAIRNARHSLKAD
jgi:hypothetical protein